MHRSIGKRSYANINQINHYNMIDATIDFATHLRHLPYYTKERILEDKVREAKGLRRKRRPLRFLLDNP